MEDNGESPYSDEYMAWCRTRYLDPNSRIAAGIYCRSVQDAEKARGDRALESAK